MEAKKNMGKAGKEEKKEGFKDQFGTCSQLRQYLLLREKLPQTLFILFEFAYLTLFEQKGKNSQMKSCRNEKNSFLNCCCGVNLEKFCDAYFWGKNDFYI